MNPVVRAKFWVKCCDHMSALFNQYGSIVRHQDLRARAHSPDNRSSDEHCFQLTAFEIRMQPYHPAVELTPVSVPLHLDVHQFQGLLDRIANALSDQDRAGASAENWLRLGEFPQRLSQAGGFQQFQHRGAFPAWDHQSLNLT